MAAIFKIVASRVNNIEADQYGNVNVEPGQIWYDPDSGELRLYNGNAGGTVINSGGSGNNTALVNGTSNVIVYPSGVVAISVNGAANVAVFEGPRAQFDNVVSTGNVTATYFLGNGSQLTGLPTSYSNANVQAYLPTYSGNIGSLTATGNITVVDGIFIGNGAGLTGVVASSNVGSASKLSNGTTEFNIPVANGNVVGNIGGVTNVYNFGPTEMTVAGNISGQYISGIIDGGSA